MVQILHSVLCGYGIKVVPRSSKPKMSVQVTLSAQMAQDMDSLVKECIKVPSRSPTCHGHHGVDSSGKQLANISLIPS